MNKLFKDGTYNHEVFSIKGGEAFIGYNSPNGNFEFEQIPYTRPKQYFDISIHFTVKGQSISEINEKFDKYIIENNETLPFDFSEPNNPRSVLHHCFLPEEIVKEKGFPNDIYDIVLGPTSEHKICWYGVSGLGLVWDRRYMLENLKKLNGLSIFIGKIKDGVKEEYDLILELGGNILHIK